MSMGWVFAGLYVAAGIVGVMRYLRSPDAANRSEEELDADDQNYSM